MKNTEFINTLNKINQIFKGVYNSKDKFENIWNVQDNRFIMHDPTQLPSFMEVILDSSSLVTAKGAKTAKGLMYDEFLELIHQQNVSINSIAYFNYLKELNKDGVELIEVKNNNIYIDNDCITKPYKVDKLVFDKDENDLLASFDFTSDDINKIISLGNKPFNLIFDFTDEIVKINESIDKDSEYLNVKTSIKFLPLVKECKDTGGTTVSASVYSTKDDYMYDIVFTVGAYTINKKGETKIDPISVRYGIRIVEL